MKDEMKQRYYNSEFGKIGYAAKSYRRGKLKLMCPHCFQLYERRIIEKIETSINIAGKDDKIYEPMIYLDTYPKFTIMECICGETFVKPIELDWNIAEIVSAFNKKGFKTDFSCEGHITDDPMNKRSSQPYIFFSDTSIMDYYNQLPISWEIDYDMFKRDVSKKVRVRIYTEMYNREESFKELREFIDSLPQI